MGDGDSESTDWKKAASVAGAAAACISVLVGLNTLLGWNPLKSFAHPAHSASPTIIYPVENTPADTPYSPPPEVTPEDIPSASPSPTDSPPDFTVESSQWDGQCTPQCPM